jgi:hypothetical protein
MPNTWTNQSTPGDTKQDAQDKTPTSFTLLVIKSSTKQLLIKPKHSVLVRQEKITVQYVPNVYGMPSKEMNHTESGED